MEPKMNGCLLRLDKENVGRWSLGDMKLDIDLGDMKLDVYWISALQGVSKQPKK